MWQWTPFCTPNIQPAKHEVPNFITCNNNNDWAAAKTTHMIALKTQNNDVNMNTTLINALLTA